MARSWKEWLHPRDRKGRFIRKFGIVRFFSAFDGSWQYGRAIGSSKTGGKDHVTVRPVKSLKGEPTGGKDITLPSSKLYVADEAKAHLKITDVGVTKVGGQAGSNAGGLYKMPSLSAPADGATPTAKGVIPNDSPLKFMDLGKTTGALSESASKKMSENPLDVNLTTRKAWVVDTPDGEKIYALQTEPDELVDITGDKAEVVVHAAQKGNAKAVSDFIDKAGTVTFSYEKAPGTLTKPAELSKFKLGSASPVAVAGSQIKFGKSKGSNKNVSYWKRDPWGENKWVRATEDGGTFGPGYTIEELVEANPGIKIYDPNHNFYDSKEKWDKLLSADVDAVAELPEPDLTVVPKVGEWTHPTTGEKRNYLNNWRNFAGFGKEVTGKVWFTEDGQLHAQKIMNLPPGTTNEGLLHNIGTVLKAHGYDVDVPGATPESADIPGTAVEETFYVKKAKTKTHGNNEALANALYAEAGVYVPEVDFAEDGNIYSKIVKGTHDMPAQLKAKNKEWIESVQSDFAVDAWLGNWDVFGMTWDNILTEDETGAPVRIDNGGALLYRAMGSPKGADFDSKVDELESMKTGKKAQIFGPGVMPKELELDGAKRVAAITPERIDEMVAEHNMPKSLADTLKARRKYIADYYGIPLPETMQPAGSDHLTTAPLLDPLDKVRSGGLGRKWSPKTSTLFEVTLLAENGDQIRTSKGVHTFKSMADLDKVYAEPGPYQLKKTKTGDRPEHNTTLSGDALLNAAWERGDKINYDGQWQSVFGVNRAAGAIYLEGPDGIFPINVYKLDKGAAVQLWNPPALPDTDIKPAVKTGMAADKEKAIKADLATPLPDNGPPAAPKSAEATKTDGIGAPTKGQPKMMPLGDGTVAKTGDKVVSKFGGEYIFVKPKGPYAVVTDPNSDDPTKTWLKKASTLSQPGVEKAPLAPEGDVAKPQSKNGITPAVGMTAKAKDGTIGKITMVSPDGKFVFLDDGSGKKKRKSTTAVDILGDDKNQILDSPPLDKLENGDTAGIPEDEIAKLTPVDPAELKPTDKVIKAEADGTVNVTDWSEDTDPDSVLKDVDGKALTLGDAGQALTAGTLSDTLKFGDKLTFTAPNGVEKSMYFLKADGYNTALMYNPASPDLNYMVTDSIESYAEKGITVSLSPTSDHEQVLPDNALYLPAKSVAYAIPNKEINSVNAQHAPVKVKDVQPGMWFGSAMPMFAKSVVTHDDGSATIVLKSVTTGAESSYIYDDPDAVFSNFHVTSQALVKQFADELEALKGDMDKPMSAEMTAAAMSKELKSGWSKAHAKSHFAPLYPAKAAETWHYADGTEMPADIKEELLKAGVHLNKINKGHNLYHGVDKQGNNHFYTTNSLAELKLLTETGHTAAAFYSSNMASVKKIDLSDAGFTTMSVVPDAITPPKYNGEFTSNYILLDNLWGAQAEYVDGTPVPGGLLKSANLMSTNFPGEPVNLYVDPHGSVWKQTSNGTLYKRVDGDWEVAQPTGQLKQVKLDSFGYSSAYASPSAPADAANWPSLADYSYTISTTGDTITLTDDGPGHYMEDSTYYAVGDSIYAVRADGKWYKRPISSSGGTWDAVLYPDFIDDIGQDNLLIVSPKEKSEAAGSGGTYTFPSGYVPMTDDGAPVPNGHKLFEGLTVPNGTQIHVSKFGSFLVMKYPDGSTHRKLAGNDPAPFVFLSSTNPETNPGKYHGPITATPESAGAGESVSGEGGPLKFSLSELPPLPKEANLKGAKVTYGEDDEGHVGLTVELADGKAYSTSNSWGPFPPWNVGISPGLFADVYSENTQDLSLDAVIPAAPTAAGDGPDGATLKGTMKYGDTGILKPGDIVYNGAYAYRVSEVLDNPDGPFRYDAWWSKESDGSWGEMEVWDDSPTSGLVKGQYSSEEFYVYSPVTAPTPTTTPAAVPTKSVDISEATTKPSIPGVDKPSAEAILSWGGDVTKDGHIPTPGMHVKGKGPMTGKVISVSKDKTKATVLTSDGKKSTRLISALSSDTYANYAAYAPPAVPVEIPEGMQVPYDDPSTVMKKAFADTHYIGGLINSHSGVKNAATIVKSAIAPNGTKYARVHFTMTTEQRKLFTALLQGNGPAEKKGAWKAFGEKAISDLKSGDVIALRYSNSQSEWVADKKATAPTHRLKEITAAGSYVFEPVDGGADITTPFTKKTTSSGLPYLAKSYEWDAEAPAPVVPSYGFAGLSDAAVSKGWKWDDHKLVTPKVDVKTGKMLSNPGEWTISSPVNMPGGALLKLSNGVTIEVVNPTDGQHSYKGSVAISIPEGLDPLEAYGTALAELGMDHKPMTKENVKAQVRPMLRNMLSLDMSSPDSITSAWSDEKLFASLAQSTGVSDIGWHDVRVSVQAETGRTEYLWSDRVTDSLAAKSGWKHVVRGGKSANKVPDVAQYGALDATTRRLLGFPGAGNCHDSDANNNAGNGSFMSGGKVNKFDTINLLNKAYGGGYAVYHDARVLFSRINDIRPGALNHDAFGKGQGNGSNAFKGYNQQKSADLWMAGGMPTDTIGYIVMNFEADREVAIKELKKRGVTTIAGRPIEEVIRTKTDLNQNVGVDNIPPYVVQNAVNLMDLPDEVEEAITPTAVEAGV